LKELRQLVERQLRGPVADHVKSQVQERLQNQLGRWGDPAAKLERRKKRAAAAAWFYVFVAGLLAVVAAVLIVWGAQGQVMSGAVAGVFAAGSLALGVRSAARVRTLNRTPLPAAAAPARMPSSKSLAREPMERLADAERALAELLRQLGSPRSNVPPDTVEHARATGAEAASALREVAGQLQSVERARDLAPPADRPALAAGVRRLRDQLDEGLDGYGRLIAAAGHLVAASSTGGPDSGALTDASDRLHGLAVALRELFP
jgi:hypothetical protein